MATGFLAGILDGAVYVAFKKLKSGFNVPSDPLKVVEFPFIFQCGVFASPRPISVASFTGNPDVESSFFMDKVNASLGLSVAEEGRRT